MELIESIISILKDCYILELFYYIAIGLGIMGIAVIILAIIERIFY